MNITLATPDLESYVREQVDAGDFASVDEVVSAALMRMREAGEPDALDADTLAAVDRARAGLDRGEAIDAEEIKDEWRRKLGAL
ncbi:MAG: Bacterial antitoxin of ParD toxin-antitoxin type system [Phycisphaerales bacterium]|nr:Bacterial antitoxin of ParD toxin-antitoxin type system [Phycisphaerales bacterium]